MYRRKARHGSVWHGGGWLRAAWHGGEKQRAALTRMG